MPWFKRKEKKPAEWRDVGAESEFESTDRKLVDLEDGEQVGVFKVDGAWYAMSMWCSHQKTTMIHGDRNGCELECPLHGSRFDLRTGRPLDLPATRPVKTYPVRVEDGRVKIEA